MNIYEISNKKFEYKIYNIKSKYILQIIFSNFPKSKILNIIKYNKGLQNRLNFNIDDYKEYSEIEIEIIPSKNEYGEFININNKDDESYFHIYFNDDKEETKRINLNKKDKASKIRIVIDYQIKSFTKLFYYCKCIEIISFNKFHRKNIINMKRMFSNCFSLKQINFYNLLLVM